MNIFKNFSKEIKDLVLKNQNQLGLFELNNFKGMVVENPPLDFNFEISCNICLILAKANKLNPKELASKIKKLFLDNLKDFNEIEIAGPGFLNIRLEKSFLKKIVDKILIQKNTFGSANNNKKYNIEFVSANPTGPMHVGHCRGAIFGDVLANLLKFNGNQVVNEYYINDYGNQIANFTKSVYLRIREILYKEKFKDNSDLYPGEYIVDIAKKIIKEKSNIDFSTQININKILEEESLRHSMIMIKEDLGLLGIKHDIFTSEKKIVSNDLVNLAVKELKHNNYVVDGFLEPPKGEEIKNWKKTKRMIFKSTLFGDDADRALQKNNGSWTYFANDIAYHMDKVSRKYDFLINILGADHTGYVKRISAAVTALSNNKTKLDCKICQLVKLYKKGKPYKMSKRAGDFISAQDLLNEVNKDSIRFMMLNRSNDVELDFDFDKVLEKSKENPVFYVQYCYARISSLFKTLNLEMNSETDLSLHNLDLNLYENNILRKIFDWPKVIETASNKNEPHRIPFYLYELATLFHSYWSKGNDDEQFKFIIKGKLKNPQTLIIIKLVALTITNGMKILGVSLPNKM